MTTKTTSKVWSGDISEVRKRFAELTDVFYWKTVEKVAKKFSITTEALISEKDHPCPDARAEVYMHFCDRGLSSPEVGKLFMRDHTTVLAALRRKKERAVTMTFLQAVKASDRFVSLKTGRSFSMFDDGILPSPTREEILGVWAEVSG